MKNTQEVAMSNTDTVAVFLTEKEHSAICLIAGNGWGDGDFAGYGGSHVPTQKRAMEKLENGGLNPVPDLLAALEDCLARLLWCSGSADFGPGGQAHKGWQEGPRRAIERARDLICKAKGEA